MDNWDGKRIPNFGRKNRWSNYLKTDLEDKGGISWGDPKSWRKDWFLWSWNWFEFWTIWIHSFWWFFRIVSATFFTQGTKRLFLQFNLQYFIRPGITWSICVISLISYDISDWIPLYSKLFTTVYSSKVIKLRYKIELVAPYNKRSSIKIL